MHAYWPSSWTIVVAVAAGLGALLGLGFLLTRIRSAAWARPGAWSLVVIGFTLMERLVRNEGAGWRMLTICATLLFTMKAVVAVEERAAGRSPLSFLSWLEWATLWPGMRPSLFARPRGAACAGGAELFAQGIARLLIGVVLVALAATLFHATGRRLMTTLLLLVGTSLILHFGVFNLLAGLWRYRGVRAYRLFRAPLFSTSLAEFWGRRWNLPFTEMIQRAVYRPLSGRLGRESAAAVGFLYSGLLHELAISVPVRAGYGLPILYFGIHGMLLLLERRLGGTGWWVERHPWAGVAWTAFWLVAPLPLLFHPPFIRGVLWPLIGAA